MDGREKGEVFVGPEDPHRHIHPGLDQRGRRLGSRVVADTILGESTDHSRRKLLQEMFTADRNYPMITIGNDDVELHPSELYTILVVVVKDRDVPAFDSIQLSLHLQTGTIVEGKTLAGGLADTEVKGIFRETATDLLASAEKLVVVFVPGLHVVTHEEQDMLALLQLDDIRGVFHPLT